MRHEAGSFPLANGDLNLFVKADCPRERRERCDIDPHTATGWLAQRNNPQRNCKGPIRKWTGEQPSPARGLMVRQQHNRSRDRFAPHLIHQERKVR